MSSKIIATILALLLIGTMSCSKNDDKKAEPKKTPEAQLLAPVIEGEPGIGELNRVDVEPVAVNMVKPEYPESARAAGTQGTVYVEVLVGKGGRVKKAVAIKTEGGAELEKAAVAAALRWIFTPAKQKGQPVEAWVTIPFRFYLK